MFDNDLSSKHLLVLATATHTFAVAIPMSSMPVLFEEISRDMGLNLVQIGTVWGMLGLSGVLFSLFGGVLGDKFGIKLVLGLACILGGIAGASRGLASGFFSLAATVFLFGIVRTTMPVNVHKMVSTYFHGKNLGTANGIVSMGMGIGFMVGSMISATILSPLLGGWRNVFYLYGGISIVLGIIWLLPRRMPQPSVQSTMTNGAIKIREALPKLMRIKKLWLIGLVAMLRTGCIMGMVGYLPLYLRSRGWEVASADGTLAAFYAMSILFVMPTSILSDKIGSRKVILTIAAITAIVGIGLLTVASDIAVWVLVLAVGIFFDGFWSLIVTLTQETKGVADSGIAMGILFTFAQLGIFISPPLGNSLASLNPGFPFLFWAFLSVISLIVLMFIKETGRKR